MQPDVAVGIAGPGGAFDASAGYVLRTGASFAFNVVPTIIFFSALMSLLYHLGVMSPIMKAIGWLLQRTIKTSGAETIAAAGNIFLGAAQVPLLIKPFVAKLTPSELVSVMVVSFATASSAVMAVYVIMLQPHIMGVAGTLMAASILDAPAGLLLSKILMPETGVPVTAGSLDIVVERTDSGVIDAVCNGALKGIQLAISIVAIVIALVALVALLNAGLGWLGGLVGQPGASLQTILGQLLRPLVWVMGVPWAEHCAMWAASSRSRCPSSISWRTSSSPAISPPEWSSTRAAPSSPPTRSSALPTSPPSASRSVSSAASPRAPQRGRSLRCPRHDRRQPRRLHVCEFGGAALMTSPLMGQEGWGALEGIWTAPVGRIDCDPDSAPSPSRVPRRRDR